MARQSSATARASAQTRDQQSAQETEPGGFEPDFELIALAGGSNAFAADLIGSGGGSSSAGAVEDQATEADTAQSAEQGGGGTTTDGGGGSGDGGGDAHAGSGDPAVTSAASGPAGQAGGGAADGGGKEAAESGSPELTLQQGEATAEIAAMGDLTAGLDAGVSGDVAAWLDTNAKDLGSQALLSLIDMLESTGAIGIGVIEELTPIVGYYDAVGDQWNRFEETIETLPWGGWNNLSSGLIAVTSAGAMVTSMLGNVLRHTSWLLTLLGALLNIGGPIGAAIDAILSFIQMLMEFAAALLDIITILLNLVQMATAAIAFALNDDPTVKAQYLTVGVIGAEHGFVSLIDGVMSGISGVISGVDVVLSIANAITLGTVPASAVAEPVQMGVHGLNALLKPIAKEVVTTVGKNVIKDAFPELGDDALRNDELLPHLPDPENIPGHIADWTKKQLNLDESEGQNTSSLDSDASADVLAGLDVDHSPMQVEALAAGQADIMAQLEAKDGAMAELDAAEEYTLGAIEMAAEYDQGLSEAQAVGAEQQGILNEHAAASTDALSETSTLMPQLESVSGMLGEGQSVFGGVNDLPDVQSAIPSEDDGLLGDLAGMAMDAVMPMIDDVVSGIAEGIGIVTGGMSDMDGMSGVVGEVLPGMSDASAQLNTQVSQDQAMSAEVGAVVDTAAGQQAEVLAASAEATASLAGISDARTQSEASELSVLALFEAMGAEGERQDEANWLFEEAYGPVVRGEESA